MRTDSLALLVVYALATIAMAVYTVVDSEHRYVSAMFVVLGLAATWRQFLKWQSAP